MEVMLNLVDTLMEIGVHKNWQTDEDQDPQPETVDPLAEFQKEKESKARITSTTKHRFFFHPMSATSHLFWISGKRLWYTLCSKSRFDEC